MKKILNIAVKIICCCDNSEKWISKTINSVKSQSFQNFEFYLYLDAPTDETRVNAEKYINFDTRFKINEGQIKIYGAMARWKLIKNIKEASNRDIVVLLDGDDWLSSPDSLMIVVQNYLHNDIVVCHGNYITETGVVCNWSKDYSVDVKKNNLFRDSPWTATHLRSFKFGLINFIDESILFDDSGLPFTTATDVALFMPLLELAGIYSNYIKEPIYVYNTRNGEVMNKDRVSNQRYNENLIRKKLPYKPVNFEIISKLI